MLNEAIYLEEPVEKKLIHLLCRSASHKMAISFSDKKDD